MKPAHRPMLWSLIGCLFGQTGAFAAERPRAFREYVVAADHPAASRAGAEVLANGGNVVDAAVATGFALAVVRPASSGLGGGGFMVIWDADDKRAVAIDYRERAPLKATRDMYRDPRNPKRADGLKSRIGHLAIAVPGHVAGLCLAQERYGKLKLSDVLAPAIRLAREGVPVDAHDLSVQKSMLELFDKHPDYRKRFRPLFDGYLNGGRRWRLGERFRSPLLAVLERIARDGADGFYKGPVAAALVAEMKRGGGVISHEDLAGMKPVVRSPLRSRFDGFDVVAMPPPSSGGAALIQTLNIISQYEAVHPAGRLEKLGHNSPAYVHLLTEAMKHAFADRAEHLGDADFVDVPIERLTSITTARALAKRIDGQRTLPLKAYGRYLPVNDGGTTHFSIVDKAGNAVACTETINTVFGSLVVEPKFGIVLNNEMDDFAAVPGVPNAFGLIQSENNAVAPRKKPLSSMSPTILVKDGKAAYVAGGSGGPRIISGTLQVLLNVSRFGMTPQRAVSRPRFHHQWVPDVLFVEPALIDVVRRDLESRGHKLQRRKNLSAEQAVSRDGAMLRGASDPRKHGLAAGR